MVELLDIDLGHNVLRVGEMRFQILKIRTIYCMRSRLKEVTRSLWAEPKVQQKGEAHCFGHTFRKNYNS